MKHDDNAGWIMVEVMEDTDVQGRLVGVVSKRV